MTPAVKAFNHGRPSAMVFEQSGEKDNGVIPRRIGRRRDCRAAQLQGWRAARIHQPDWLRTNRYRNTAKSFYYRYRKLSRIMRCDHGPYWQTGGWTERHTYRPTDRQRGWQTDRQADKQTDRQTERPTGRQKVRQIDKQKEQSDKGTADRGTETEGQRQWDRQRDIPRVSAVR